MSEKHNIIPVWFFVGVLLLVYGVLILGERAGRVVASTGHGFGRVARSGVVGRAADRAGEPVLFSV